jgi:hypothetical protein
MKNSVIVRVDKSNIHNKGLFTNDVIEKGCCFLHSMQLDENGRVKKQGEPTYYINHSLNRNVNAFLSDDNIYLVANRDIMPNEEILIDYSDYNKLGLKANILDFKNLELFNSLKKDIPEMNRPIGFKYKLKKINLKNMYNRDKSNFTGYSRNLNYVPANIVSYVNPNDTFYYGADASKNESEDISKKVSPLTIIVVASFIIGGLYLYKKIQNK